MGRLIIITATILVAISTTAYPENVKMWRGADGVAHFGDAPPAGKTTEKIDVTPQNRTGVYGKHNQILNNRQRELEQMRQRYYAGNPDPHSQGIEYQEPEPSGLTYDDERELRNLEVQRNQIRDRMRNKRLSVGDAIVYEEELRGVNAQMREIHDRSRQPEERRSLEYDEEVRLRRLQLEKNQLRDRMKSRRLSVGDGIVLEQEMRSINQQIMDIERSR